MKRYLLVGTTVLFMSANASLQEDFARMDQEQEQLFSDMRKSTIQDTDDFDEDDRIISKENLDVKNAKKTIDIADTQVKDAEHSNNIRQKEVLELQDKEVGESSSKKLETIEIEMKEIAIESEKNKELNLKVERAEKEARLKAAKEKEILLQREAEKREVEAYEKLRAEKLAKEAAEKEEIEKKKLAKIKADVEAKKEKENKASTLTQGVDINVTRDLEEKTKAADVEYAKAVLEMKKAD